VNKGTLELKKRHWKLSLHPILRVVWLSGFMENFVDAESKYLSHLTVVFSASYSKSGQAKIIFKDVYYKSRIVAEESR